MTYREEASIWDFVWRDSIYAGTELRIKKAKDKVDLILQSVDIEQNWKIIDIGCGGGYVSEELFRRTSCNITGVDFSETAIKRATERLSNLPIGFECADALSMPFDSGSFDLAVCCGSMEHVRDQTAYLSEVYRVLKPNGVVFITTSNKISDFLVEKKLIPPALVYSLKILLLALHVMVESQDLKVWGKLDRLGRLFNKNIGRYVVATGRKR